jgi:transposase
MPKPCSVDLRERVLEAVMAGASRREAAERFEISASSAVKWLQRWDETGSVVAKPTGGSISPLEEHADFLLGLIAEQSDLTLEPISKSSEEDNEAGELDEAEEVLGVILPADEDAALPLDPSEEALDQPASHVAA